MLTMAVVNNVRLALLPAGAPANEAISAPSQQVYIDLTAGTMTRVQSNAAGIIVGVPPAPSAVSLDDSRDYHVMVSPTALPTAPSAASGATVRVSGGRLAVPPRIAIKITRSAGGAAASLACVLKIGGVDTNITTTAAGWIMSNNISAGEVMVRCNTALLKPAAAANPAATLAIAPNSPVTRGTNATITVTPPAGAAGFKVTEWKYDISHTNPGPAATARAATATVTRPATESAGTFDQNWQGVICASGTVKTKFVVGAVVRASGDAAVSATLQAVDPVEVTLAVNVTARTGAAWTTTLTEKPVEDLVRPINSFQDTGQHDWDLTSPPLPNATSVADGPNRGCQFLASAAATFTSTPRINKLLSDPTSTFSQAQDKARLTAPAPLRVIPRNLYTVGAGGAITETPPGSIATHFSIQSQFNFTPHMIDQPRLLAGTRRHEFEDPLPGQKSHKGNCLKALRALEPVQFAEALVKVPNAQLNFSQLFHARLNMVANVAATHDIVDEAQTRTDHQVRFTTGQAILGVNVDSNGNLIAPVWNPTTNQMLR
jgi:hypothetical protein